MTFGRRVVVGAVPVRKSVEYPVPICVPPCMLKLTRWPQTAWIVVAAVMAVVVNANGVSVVAVDPQCMKRKFVRDGGVVGAAVVVLCKTSRAAGMLVVVPALWNVTRCKTAYWRIWINPVGKVGWGC